MIQKTLMLALASLSLMACTEGDVAEVSGRLAMKGSSMHTYLVIEDTKTHKVLKINNKEAFDLMQRQNETVTLKVKLIKKAIGAGFPAVVEVLEVK